MATLSETLAQVYSMIMLFFTTPLLKLLILLHKRSAANDLRPLTITRKFLELVEEKHPASRYEVALLGLECSKCVVCLSHYENGDEIRKLKCKHMFHKDCLDTWLQQDGYTCPLCRSLILPEEAVPWRDHFFDEYIEGSHEEEQDLIILANYMLHGSF